jgi:hypothetical protein
VKYIPALLLLFACQKTPPPTLERPAPSRITAQELTSTLEGSRARGKPGDLSLTNGRVSLIIEKSLPKGRRSFLGQPIDLFLQTSSYDRVEWLGLSLQLEGKPAAVAYQKTEIIPATKEEPTHLRATGVVNQLEVTTAYRLKEHEDLLWVTSTVTNNGDQTLSLSMCQTGYLGNYQPFISGEGFLERPTKTPVEWLGYEAGNAFYSVGLSKGAAALQSTAVVIDEAAFHNGFLLCNDVKTLAPGEALSQEWLWGLSIKDLADAVALFWEGKEAPLLTLSGQAAQEKNVRAQRVDIYSEGRPFTRAALRDSRFAARLPPGDYEVFVSTDGGGRGDKQHLSLQENVSITLPSVSLGLLEVKVTQDKSDTPARIIISPEKPGVIEPLFHSLEQSNGAGNSIYTLDGMTSVALSPGWYKVLATRGLEYDLPSARVEIKAGKTSAVTLSLSRVIDSTGAIAADLHLHSMKSKDSNIMLESRVISLIAEGVELAVSTDHDSITDYAPVLQSLGVEGLISTMIGEEITTAEPNLGHFNTFPITPNTEGSFPEPVFSFRTTADDLFTQARALSDGPEVIQVNHPRMEPKLGYFSIMSLDPKTGKAAPGFSLNFDTIEVFNGLELAHLDKVEQNLQDWYSLLTLGYRKVATGSSDSHVLSLQEVGYPRTYVFTDDTQTLNKTDVIDALKAGRAMVTNGPYLRALANGVGPGGEVAADKTGKVTVRIEVQAAPWVDVSSVEIVVNGEVVWKQKVSLKSGVVKVSKTLPVKGGDWLVVIVRGEKPYQDVLPLSGVLPFAFQNPIWISL